MTVRALSLSACLLASLTGINLPAGQISPGFSAAGDMTVIQRAIDSADVNSLLTALPAMIGGDSDGWFSSLDAATTTIDGWNRSTESVGSDFDPAVFIYFDAEATMPTLGNIRWRRPSLCVLRVPFRRGSSCGRPRRGVARHAGAAGNPERLAFQFRRQSLEHRRSADSNNSHLFARPHNDRRRKPGGELQRAVRPAVPDGGFRFPGGRFDYKNFRRHNYRHYEG